MRVRGVRSMVLGGKSFFGFASSQYHLGQSTWIGLGEPVGEVFSRVVQAEDHQTAERNVIF